MGRNKADLQTGLIPVLGYIPLERSGEQPVNTSRVNIVFGQSNVSCLKPLLQI